MLLEESRMNRKCMFASATGQRIRFVARTKLPLRAWPPFWGLF